MAHFAETLATSPVRRRVGRYLTHGRAADQCRAGRAGGGDPQRSRSAGVVAAGAVGEVKAAAGCCDVRFSPRSRYRRRGWSCPLRADIVAKVENRTTLKLSQKLIFGLLCCCVAFQRRYEGP